MAVVIPDGFCQVDMEYSNSDDPGDAYHWIHAFANGSTVPEDLLAPIATGLGTFIAPVFDSDYTVTNVTVRTETEQFTTAVNVAGTQAGETLPQNVAVLLRLRSSDRGRGTSGRGYFAGMVPTTQLEDGGFMTEALQDDLNTAFASYYAPLIGDGITPVILHDSESPIATPSPVETIQVDRLLATQRRRLRR